MVIFVLPIAAKPCAVIDEINGTRGRQPKTNMYEGDNMRMRVG
jgi:hypothetical protein